MTHQSNARPIDLALQTLIGRPPTTEEITKFYQIRDLLGFAEHDSVWSMLLAFGHYEILYRDIPAQITEQTQQLLAEHKLALEATAGAAQRMVGANMAEAVAKASRDAIDAGKRMASTSGGNVTKGKFMLCLCAALALTAIVVSGIGVFSYQAGMRAGVESASLDAAWAATPQGKAAKAFAGLNPIQSMLDCSPNFQVRAEDNATYCIPYDPKTKLTTGWRIK
jgi:ubiquitin